MAGGTVDPGDIEGAPVLSNAKQLALGAIMAFSNFMIVLDLTIANVSVPHVAGNLGISMDQGTWIITSYAVSEAICVPLSGWLSKRFGTVRTYMFSMTGFGLFSLLCGLSPTLGMLVFARIGQGLCGAPIMPMTQTLMMRVFPPERRTQAMGAWAMTTLLGPALGPILGGWITDNYSWHWIFLINVPIAAVCVTLAAAMMKPIETRRIRQPIDAVGMGLLVFWIGCLQIMLDIGRDHDWFADWRIVSLAIGAAVGFVAFIIWELTEEHPAVDLRVFRHRGFSITVATMALAFGAYFASIVIIPQWLQGSLGYSAQDAGLTTAFTAMVSMAVMPFAARIMPKIDPRGAVSFALVWMGLMAVIRTGWTTDATFWDLSWPQLLQGIGMPFFMLPLSILTLTSVLPQETATAAGLQAFVRTLSVAVSTSLVLTYWGNSERQAHNEIAGVLQPDQAVTTLGNAGMGIDQARGMINNLVNGQSTLVAVEHTFMVAAVILFFGAVVVWLGPRPRPPVSPAPQGAGH